MIFYLTPGNAVSSSALAVEQGIRGAITVEVYQPPATEGPPENIEAIVEGFQGNVTATESPTQDISEIFDWNDPKVKREFITLEQKKLAKKANPEETKRYFSMKRDRNANIFAERNIRDYAEVQRLKKLSEKLAEIQKYMRPFPL